MRSWVLYVFIASVVLSLSAHMAFQLVVASKWFETSAVPRELANGAPPERPRRAQHEEEKLVPIPTVDCATFLRDAALHRLEFRDPNEGKPPSTYQRRTSPLSPQDRPFWISLHVPTFDPVRWTIMKTGSYYERTLESIWRRVLRNSPSGSRVLDVGANIGYFGLVSLAASPSNDVVVDSFEPNPVNFLRTCESLALNNWTVPGGHHAGADTPGLHIHPVGVSDTNEVLPFLTNKGNPGQSQFATDVSEARALAKASRGALSLGTNKSVVTLDAFAISRGWLDPEDDEGRRPLAMAHAASPTPPHIAVLKVDVEALEHKVILGASRLLRSHLVKNVFMEVSARSKEEEANGRRAAEALVRAGYRLQGHGGFSGPGTPVPDWPHDDPKALVDRILAESKKVAAKQINLWWTV